MSGPPGKGISSNIFREFMGYWHNTSGSRVGIRHRITITAGIRLVSMRWLKKHTGRIPIGIRYTSGPVSASAIMSFSGVHSGTQMEWVI